MCGVKGGENVQVEKALQDRVVFRVWNTMFVGFSGWGTLSI